MFLFIGQTTLADSNPLTAKWTSGKRHIVRIAD